MADPYVPYILSIFSNPPKGAAGYLSYLDDEREELQLKMDNFNNTQPINYRTLNDTPQDKLSSSDIAKRINDQRKLLTVIHYSGHADQVLLSLNETDVRARNFVKYVAQCEKIRLVVLNGCSTVGFVKLLLEDTAVKAVVATSKPVKDEQAAEFSDNFYMKLLEKKSVADSFTFALSVVLKGGGYKKNNNIYGTKFIGDRIDEFLLLEDEAKAGNARGILTKKVASSDENDQMADWCIYSRANDILDWNLFEEATAPEKEMLEIETKIRSLENELDVLEIDMEDLKFAIRNVKDENKLSEQEQASFARQKKKLSVTEKAIAQVTQQKDLLMTRKKETSQDINANERIQNFSNSIVSLNYKDQGNRISQLRKSQQLGQFSCFTLHGDDKACLSLLSRRLLNWLKFSGVNRVILDSGSINANSFWYALQEKVLGRMVSNDPDDIVNAIVKQKYDADDNLKNHLLFLFRNRQRESESAALFNQMIFTFWKDFVTRLQLADAENRVYKNGVYAFIIDDSCELIPVENGYKSSREEEYVNRFGNDQIVKPTFYLLPVVTYTNANEIWDWLQDSSINDYKFKISEIEEIVNRTKGVLLDTIEELSVIGVTDKASRLRISGRIRDDINKTL